MTVVELEEKGFQGVDVNLSISLGEYGIAWKTDYSGNGEILFYYGIGFGTGNSNEYVQFDACTVEIGDFRDLFDWVDISALASYIGATVEEFDNIEFIEKIITGYHYYGPEIFGESYFGGFSIQGLEN